MPPPVVAAGRPGARRVVDGLGAGRPGGGRGQAIDAPRRRSGRGARLFEYVKVCSLYGAGFFYIPGTDTCLKIGGMVRADYGFNAGGSHGQSWNGGNAAYNRNTDDFRTRVRTQISFDARTQTEYGTLRSFTRLGMQYSTDDDPNGSKDGRIYFDRAFIQLGGWTFGKTQSFFDAYAGGAHSWTTLVGASDTGNGINVAAYTAQFGNGFTGTISIEDPTFRRAPGVFNGNVVDLQAAGANYQATNNGTYGTAGVQVPDIVGNLRVDQAWGSAQLSAALHQVRPLYYGATEGTGAPDDKFGFAIQGGVQVKLPWAAGDMFTVQVAYAEGAGHYTYGDVFSSYAVYSGASVFEGLNFDAVHGATGGLELVKTFGVNAGIEHYWTPMLRTSLFGAYRATEFTGAAKTIICADPAYATITGCNPDWSMYQVGTRTVWNPVKNLDVGLELLYTKFEGEHGGGFRTQAITGNHAADPAVAKDADVFSGMVRVQRNFWP